LGRSFGQLRNHVACTDKRLSRGSFGAAV
jgi:hypothetical protein